MSIAVVFIAARFASTAVVDLSHVAGKVIRQVGYVEQEFNAKTCSILTAPQEKPLDEQQRIDESMLSDQEIDNVAVRNQVTVFGFACDHSPNFMPLPIALGHMLSQKLTEVRNNGAVPYLMPDAKVQVGVDYINREPSRIHSVTISTSQRDEHQSLKTLNDDMIEAVIRPVLDVQEIKRDDKTRIFINPDGIVLTGGPTQHSGLTGRKNAVDTYGEYSRHSGDALSGKDPMRIDRIGAYVARYAAKNVVAAGLAKECEVTASYSIGLAKPVSLQVETFGTGKIADTKITALVKKHFDFRLLGIIKRFNLRNLSAYHPLGFYQKLAAYGHVGRTDIDLPWEKTDKVDVLSEEAKG